MKARGVLRFKIRESLIVIIWQIYRKGVVILTIQTRCNLTPGARGPHATAEQFGGTYSRNCHVSCEERKRAKSD